MSIARISSPLGKITVFVVICCCCLPAQAKYGGGTGEPNDPYQIRNANHMQAIGADSNDWDEHFILMADIDLAEYTGEDFNTIGECVGYNDPNNKPFTGVFDGNGHTISNFTYTSTATHYIGLFGYVDDPNAEIRSLGLIDPNVDAGTGYYVGSLVGLIWEGTVTACYAESGSVSGGRYVGGLVGGNEGGTITNCYSTGSVSGGSAIGGLVGKDSGTITNCYAEGGSVSGDQTVGGLVGVNYGTITNCYSEANVSGTTTVGGLLGWNYYATVFDCYSTGSVSGTHRVGGLVGISSSSDVIASFWDIETSGQTNSAGGTDLSTADMQMQVTFTDAGWDFTTPIWKMNCEGMSYPKLSWWQPVLGDFLCPDGVDFVDYSFFASHWAEDNCGASNDCDGTDLDLLETVDIKDLRIFVDNWLRGF